MTSALSIPPPGPPRWSNGHVLGLFPLQMEYYFDIAEKSLDLCIVDETSRPVIQNFRMDLGEGINPNPCKDNLILGANNLLLNNCDFVVTELTPQKPFDFTPFRMQTKFDFIEGYVGNDTIREWRKFDSIYHAVFACMRGTEGYPLGEAYQSVAGGLLLRPAIPSREIFGESNTYGPMANFKVSLRELPDQGNFRVTVRASRYDDGLLLDSGTPVPDPQESASCRVLHPDEHGAALTNIEQPGIYQVDVAYVMNEPSHLLRLKLNERDFSVQIRNTASAPATVGTPSEQHAAVMIVRLPSGPLALKTSHSEKTSISRVTMSLLDDNSEQARQFQAFEKRQPLLGVHLGLRRDCGSTLNPVSQPQSVSSQEPQEFTFTGAINDFPYPSVEKDNVNYLAGIREIGVRSEFTDGRPMPRLKIHSVEFEGPLYDNWPPVTHRNIFPDSSTRDDKPAYAREIIQSFMTRAWRRPVSEAESATVVGVWERSFAETGDFQQSIKDALLVVLTAPQFLFLIENSASPAAEDVDAWELASKLSYFLWNMPPDQQLLNSAAAGTLRAELDEHTSRMMKDPRFNHFVDQFASQWLSLDKFDVLEVDRSKYPQLTRDTKAQLRHS